MVSAILGVENWIFFDIQAFGPLQVTNFDGICYFGRRKVRFLAFPSVRKSGVKNRPKYIKITTTRADIQRERHRIINATHWLERFVRKRCF